MSRLYGNGLALEARPDYALKARLEDFLDEISLVCQKYHLLIDPYTEAGITVLDLLTERIVGVGLGYFVSERNPGKILGYDFLDGSVLDGSWLIDGPEGPVEQRYVDGRHELSERALRRIREQWMIPDAAIEMEQRR
jgi:hypothetical protein